MSSVSHIGRCGGGGGGRSGGCGGGDVSTAGGKAGVAVGATRGPTSGRPAVGCDKGRFAASFRWPDVD